VARFSVPAPQLALSPDEARLITLRAQGFIGTEGRRGGVPGMLCRLGAVQLDTISVLARSHELVAYSRLGAIPRERIERAYWNPGRPGAFEYWSHAACVLPIEEWPWYAFRRRAFRARGRRWHQSHEDVCKQVLARISAEGPLTATQLGGAKNGGAWWDWSDTKIAVEWLLDTGDVICARRTGWRRVYDLPERVLPPELLRADPSDAECLIHLAGVCGRALGVVTRADLTDYQRLRSFGTGKNSAGLSAEDAALAAGLVPVVIGGSTAGPPPAAAWADPAALDSGPADSPAGEGPPDDSAADRTAADRTAADRGSGRPPGASAVRRGRHRVTLLSPFDSLVWDRKRTLRIFGFAHSLEAYVPSARRVHGYYTMPLLARGQLVGRVDPARSGQTLVAHQLSVDKPWAAEAMARALVEAAAWVGCDTVAIDRVSPPPLEQRLRSALAAAGA
jgi:uncharacterized protein YcaQ